ncbi:hydrophobin 2 [Lactarius hengduanensis]|nr:hydrophobin 2 [Lactarius hengduanensis]
MFQKSLVSFVAAMALASGVAVSANPLLGVVARGNDPLYPPPPTTPVSQCNTGPVQCCNTLTSTSNPLVTLLSGLLPIGTIIDPNLTVGLSCLPIISSIQCSSSPVCCTGISQTGLINVGCTPINLGL